ncbi:unnamed protein product [Prorocentrum cordatum]|uniref:Uncharacterized protein n=1 Tax=Prorocentrum cordatum TaxID=2364126 RepID=A0ABN9UQA3_9DINO|nr:unnamed protein product [Polarella glacialis]
MADSEEGQAVVNETFTVCRPKDACSMDDQPAEQKITRVTVSFSKWADFHQFDEEDVSMPAIEEIRMAFITAMQKQGAEKMSGQAPSPGFARVVRGQLRVNIET